MDRNPEIRVTPSGGGAHSEYRPLPPQDSPQRVPTERLMSPDLASEGRAEGAQGQGGSRGRQQPENGDGQSIAGSQQQEVSYSQSAPRRKSVSCLIHNTCWFQHI